MKKIIALLLVAFMAIITVQAQQPNPIKWRTTVKMTSKTEGVVTFKAIIGEGWHLYGMDIPEGGPKSTSFDLSASTGIKLVGKVTASTTPMSRKDDIFGMTLTYWEKNVSFAQKFKVTKKKEAKVQATITYMGCNDQTCMPPKKENISVAVPEYKKK
jgi:thiol:disulfide interchange protein DsbD